MEIKVVGVPCGFHGSYTFYKGLQITPAVNINSQNAFSRNQTISAGINLTTQNKPTTRKCANERKCSDSNLTGFQKPLILSLGDCIPVKPWSDSPIACLAEIRMIWRDKSEPSLLTGLRLYFLPENTPMGRNCHGEDEVVAISDKVVIRAEDLLNWFDEKLEWNWGLVRNSQKSVKIEENATEKKTLTTIKMKNDNNEEYHKDGGTVNKNDRKYKVRKYRSNDKETEKENDVKSIKMEIVVEDSEEEIERIKNGNNKIKESDKNHIEKYKEETTIKEEVSYEKENGKGDGNNGGVDGHNTMNGKNDEEKIETGDLSMVSLKSSQLDFSEVEKEKLSDENLRTKVAVLSFPRYCRYRATLKRLEGVEDVWFKNYIISVLCGFSTVYSDMRIMFCRDTFDYPELETHELLCNHLAPKLKGRPRGRKKKSRSTSPFSGTRRATDSGSDSNDSDVSLFSVGKTVIKIEPRSHLRYNHRPARNKPKPEPDYKPNNRKLGNRKLPQQNQRESISSESEKEEDEASSSSSRNSTSMEINNRKRYLRAKYSGSNHDQPKQNISTPQSSPSEEKFFLRKLHEFHIKQSNDIPKMIWVSLKGVHLYAIFRQVKKLGGYEAVTAKKQWKSLFGENNPPQYIITRKKYEKILLPLERSELVTKKNSNTLKCEIKKEILDIHDDKNNLKVPSLKVSIKKENNKQSSSSDSSDDLIESKLEKKLSKEEMEEIQNKVKAKQHRHVSHRNDKLLDDNNPIIVESPVLNISPESKISVTSNSPVHVPVTVILGTGTTSDNNSKDSTEKTDSKQTGSPGRSLSDSSSQKIQIQQPHTTITVHQTTIHPQTHSKLASVQNQIQITNQIQIQQITVQPSQGSDTLTSVSGNSRSSKNAAEFHYNIKQDKDGQEVKIENRNRTFSNSSTSSHINEEQTNNKQQNNRTERRFSDKDIPFIAAGTTITPVLHSNNPISPNNSINSSSSNKSGNNPSTKESRKSPEIIDLVDSDGEQPTNNENYREMRNSSKQPSYPQRTRKSSSTSECSNIVPPVKKRKLDILREGGLEVTAISNTHGIISTAPSLNPAPLNIPQRAPTARNDRLPSDVRYNLPPNTSLSIPFESAVMSITPKISTTSMYAKTGKIFGNPKDILPPSQAPSGFGEILDLTVKSPMKFPALEIHPIPSARHVRSPPLSSNSATAIVPINLSSTTSKPQENSSSTRNLNVNNVPSSSTSIPSDTGLQITLIPSTSTSTSSSSSSLMNSKLSSQPYPRGVLPSGMPTNLNIHDTNNSNISFTSNNTSTNQSSRRRGSNGISTSSMLGGPTNNSMLPPTSSTILTIPSGASVNISTRSRSSNLKTVESSRNLNKMSSILSGNDKKISYPVHHRHHQQKSFDSSKISSNNNSSSRSSSSNAVNNLMPAIGTVAGNVNAATGTATSTATVAQLQQLPPGMKAPPSAFPFPPFIPHLAAATPHPLLPMLNPVLLSNLYTQTPNLFLPNQISQEILQLYKNLPSELGMVPISKS